MSYLLIEWQSEATIQIVTMINSNSYYFSNEFEIRQMVRIDTRIWIYFQDIDVVVSVLKQTVFGIL